MSMPVPSPSLPLAVDNMIVSEMVEVLRKALIDDVADPGEKAHTVRAGKLQADPTRETGITVLVWPAEEGSGLYVRDDQQGIHAPTYVGGNAVINVHRYDVHFYVYSRERGDTGRIIARERSQVVLARIRAALLRMKPPLHPTTGEPVDDFGEGVYLVQVREWECREAGGTGMFTWKGKVVVDVFTEQHFD